MWVTPLQPASMKFSALLALVLTLAGCAGVNLPEAALRLPESLAQAERLPVQGRQGWKSVERLAFGSFTVHDVARSLTKGGDLYAAVPGLAYEGSKRRQTFGFTLSGDGTTQWRGAAATNLRRRALDVGVGIELRNQSGFTVGLVPNGEAARAWTLELTERGEHPLTGSLRHPTKVIAVAGTDRLAGTALPLGETTGYLFELAGKPVAAVQVINQGAVWFSPDLDPALRGPITAAISALLLFEELRKTLPE
jgi:hypothetical protein